MGKLDGAYQSRSTYSLRAVWRLYLSHLMARGSTAEEMKAEDPIALDYHGDRVLDRIVGICCAFKARTLLAEVLQFMEERGIPRTVRTFTGMLEGWRKARDGPSVRREWQQIIRQPGIVLDTPVWTARVAGLVDTGLVNEALLALKELSEVRPTVPTQAGLSMEPVNAAVSGLLRQDALAAAQDVTAWAARHGVEANAATYNSFLTHFVRRKSPHDFDRVLQVMKSQGVKPTVVTLSLVGVRKIICLSGENDAEEVAAVKATFDAIEQAGFSCTMTTISSLAQALCGLPRGGCDEAINLVMSKTMSLNKQRLGPHLRTIIANRELRREHPNMDTIHAYVSNRHAPYLAQMDVVFWENIMMVLLNAWKPENRVNEYETPVERTNDAREPEQRWDSHENPAGRTDDAWKPEQQGRNYETQAERTDHALEPQQQWNNYESPAERSHYSQENQEGRIDEEALAQQEERETQARKQSRHDLDAAMTLFYWLDNLDAYISPPVLKKLLARLLWEERYHAARDMVTVSMNMWARGGKNKTTSDLRGYGFWALANDYGLLGDRVDEFLPPTKRNM